MMTSVAQPQCWICGQPCKLEECKADENGHAVHAHCYAVKLALDVAATVHRPPE
jgi:hypothetical protein